MYFSPLAMRELLAGLGERSRAAVAALLPGPLTLVLANPEHRYPLACRDDPDRLGVRLIDGPLAGASCADLPDQRQPQRRAGAVPLRRPSIPAVLAAADLAIDGGELTGLPSTVVDLTAIEEGGGWRFLREGAMRGRRAGGAAAGRGLVDGAERGGPEAHPPLSRSGLGVDRNPYPDRRRLGSPYCLIRLAETAPRQPFPSA